MNKRRLIAVPLVLAAAVAASVLAADAEATTIARVTLPEMERQATVVFVGEVSTARRVPLPGSLPATRYGFKIERTLRGGPTRSIHLTVHDLPGMPTPLGLGHRYLVFAAPIHFAQREWRLGLFGYHQASYRMLGDLQAVNESNGIVVLSRLEQRMRRA